METKDSLRGAAIFRYTSAVMLLLPLLGLSP